MAAYLSPRYVELDKLERYVRGTQYEGRPSWYDDDKPIMERGPNVVEHIATAAIRSYGDLIASQDRWPEVSSRPEEEEYELEDPLRLSEEDAELLDRGIRAIIRQTKMIARGRDALKKAMGGKSVATIVSLKEGKLQLQNQRGKLCEPDFDGERMIKLVIRYPFMKRVLNPETRKWEVKTFLYRRVIDEMTDTTYKAREAGEDGLWPEENGERWEVEEEVEHNLGFVPVVWYGFERDDGETGVVDGHALHELLLAVIDSLNRSLSQHNRASLYSGDPQWTEHGVMPNEMPGAAGRPSIIYPTEAPDGEWGKWRPNGADLRGGSRRRKGPGVVWTFQNEKSKAELHTLDGDALEAIERNRDDLREIAASAMSYVRLGDIIARDREGSGITIRNLTGEAIRWLMKPQLSRADGIRNDFGDHWILPLVDLLLRMVLVYESREQLLLAGSKQTATVAAKFMRAFESSTAWAPPEFGLVWPEYFAKTALEDMQEGEAVRADYDSRLITRATAVEARSRRYGIEDVVAYVEKLEEEDKERADEMHRLMQDAAGPTGLPGSSKAPGTGSERKPKNAPNKPVKTGRSGL